MEWVLGSPARVDAFWKDLYQRKPFIFRVEGRDESPSANGPTDGESDDPPCRPWPPVDLTDMEEMWTNAARAAASGDAAAVLTFRDGKQLDVKTPFFAYPHDCSVVVNKSDRFCHAVLQLCQALESSFPFVFCNVYLTPPGSQTVRVHSDDREVLAIQILGKKQWTVYGDPPVRLPYKDEEVGKKTPFDPTGVPVELEATVSAGDVLYLPRGFAHYARTSGEEPSLHLTIAIQTSDWDMAAVMRDGIATAVRKAVATTREVLSQDALGSAALAVEGGLATTAADEAAFQAALAESLQHLTLGTCSEAWRKRLAAMRQDRADRLAETLRPVRFPVTQATKLLWNGGIKVVGMDDVDDAPVSSVKFVGIMRRSDGQTMPLSLSAATKNVVAMMTTRHTKVPAEVRQLPLRCPLARLAVANWLLRNGCFVRVD